MMKSFQILDLLYSVSDEDVVPRVSIREQVPRDEWMDLNARLCKKGDVCSVCTFCITPNLPPPPPVLFPLKKKKTWIPGQVRVNLISTEKNILKSRVNNSLHLWSEEISLVEESSLRSAPHSFQLQFWVKMYYSASEILSGSLGIHSKRSHWRHYPRSENRVNGVIFSESTSDRISEFYCHALLIIERATNHCSDLVKDNI